VKRRPGTPEPALQRADAPTLAMSTVHLDAARLRQLLVFERTLRSLAPPGCAPEQTARAHAAAVAASGLASSDVEAPLALLRRFAANRAFRAKLADRLVRLEAQARESGATAEHVVDVRRRLAELDEALQAREEPATRRVLDAHAAEILALFAESPSSL
jgi:hypothetical protein